MISAIKINLNHASGKAARLERRREQVRWSIFSLLVMLLLGGSIWMGMENRRINEIIAGKEQQIDQIRAEIASLKQQGKNLSKKDILALRDMEKGRTLWASKLKALGQIIPHDMAITKMKFNENSLFISGISRIYRDEREFDIIEEFIDRLRSDQVFARDFADIKFSQFARLTVMNQDVITFEIRADLKNPGRDKKSGRGA